MTSTTARVFPRMAAGPLLVALVGGLVEAQSARAHQDGASGSPPGACSGIGLGLILLPFRADGTPLGSGPVTDCEALVFEATVNYQGGDTCAFESGTFTLTTPDGVIHTIATNVPCVGGSTNDPNSATLNAGRGLCAGSATFFPTAPGINYTVRNQDIKGPFTCQNNGNPCASDADCPAGSKCLGEIDVSVAYVGSFNHMGPIDSGGGSATNQLAIPAEFCTPLRRPHCPGSRCRGNH